MERIFLTVLGMSVSASAVILAVMLARLGLRKAPKRISYLLWLAVAFRLICPVSVSSPFSLFGIGPLERIAGPRAFLTARAETAAAEETPAAESAPLAPDPAQQTPGTDSAEQRSESEKNLTAPEGIRPGFAAPSLAQERTETEPGVPPSIREEDGVPGDNPSVGTDGILQEPVSQTAERLPSGIFVPDIQPAGEVGREEFLPAADPVEEVPNPPEESVPVQSEPAAEGGSDGRDSGSVLIRTAAAIWCAGSVLLLLWGVMGCAAVRRAVSTAVWREENVYESEHVGAPFILGFFRPKIYIPSSLDPECARYVLAHERFHIRKRDDLAKAAAFLLLCAYWFNPLVWAAFRMMTRDMEMRCDEAVLSDEEERVPAKAYSMAMLYFASGGRIGGVTGAPFPAPGPLAFGETDVESRIRHALSWKKSKPWAAVLAWTLAAAAIVFCVCDPMKAGAAEIEGPDAAEPSSAVSEDASGEGSGPLPDNGTKPVRASAYAAAGETDPVGVFVGGNPSFERLIRPLAGTEDGGIGSLPAYAALSFELEDGEAMRTWFGEHPGDLLLSFSDRPGVSAVVRDGAITAFYASGLRYDLPAALGFESGSFRTAAAFDALAVICVSEKGDGVTERVVLVGPDGGIWWMGVASGALGWTADFSVRDGALCFTAKNTLFAGADDAVSRKWYGHDGDLFTRTGKVEWTERGGSDPALFARPSLEETELVSVTDWYLSDAFCGEKARALRDATGCGTLSEFLLWTGVVSDEEAQPEAGGKARTVRPIYVDENGEPFSCFTLDLPADWYAEVGLSPSFTMRYPEEREVMDYSVSFSKKPRDVHRPTAGGSVDLFSLLLDPFDEITDTDFTGYESYRYVCSVRLADGRGFHLAAAWGQGGYDAPELFGRMDGILASVRFDEGTEVLYTSAGLDFTYLSSIPEPTYWRDTSVWTALVPENENALSRMIRVSAPSTWQEAVTVRDAEQGRALGFYLTHRSGEEELLFTLSVQSGDAPGTEWDPDPRLLACGYSDEKGAFALTIGYPDGAPHDVEAEERESWERTYRRMRAEIPGILDSLTFREGCTVLALNDRWSLAMLREQAAQQEEYAAWIRFLYRSAADAGVFAPGQIDALVYQLGLHVLSSSWLQSGCAFTERELAAFLSSMSWGVTVARAAYPEELAAVWRTYEETGLFPGPAVREIAEKFFGLDDPALYPDLFAYDAERDGYSVLADGWTGCVARDITVRPAADGNSLAASFVLYDPYGEELGPVIFRFVGSEEGLGLPRIEVTPGREPAVLPGPAGTESRYVPLTVLPDGAELVGEEAPGYYDISVVADCGGSLPSSPDEWASWYHAERDEENGQILFSVLRFRQSPGFEVQWDVGFPDSEYRSNYTGQVTSVNSDDGIFHVFLYDDASLRNRSCEAAFSVRKDKNAVYRAGETEYIAVTLLSCTDPAYASCVGREFVFTSSDRIPGTDCSPSSEPRVDRTAETGLFTPRQTFAVTKYLIGAVMNDAWLEEGYAFGERDVRSLILTLRYPENNLPDYPDGITDAARTSYDEATGYPVGYTVSLADAAQFARDLFGIEGFLPTGGFQSPESHDFGYRRETEEYFVPSMGFGTAGYGIRDFSVAKGEDSVTALFTLTKFVKDDPNGEYSSGHTEELGPYRLTFSSNGPGRLPCVSFGSVNTP